MLIDEIAFVSYLFLAQEDAELSEVNKEFVFRYVRLLRSGEITKGKISNVTFSRNMSSLRSFYRFLSERGIVEKSLSLF